LRGRELDYLDGAEAGFGAYGDTGFFAGCLGAEDEFGECVVFAQAEEGFNNVGDDIGLDLALWGVGEAGGWVVGGRIGGDVEMGGFDAGVA
jgi:hypothetical protein